MLVPAEKDQSTDPQIPDNECGRTSAQTPSCAQETPFPSQRSLKLHVDLARLPEGGPTHQLVSSRTTLGGQRDRGSGELVPAPHREDRYAFHGFSPFNWVIE